MSYIDHEHRQCREWQEFYDAIQAVLQPLGHEDACGRGDYWVLDDNWGPSYFQHVVYIFNLALIHPDIIVTLRKLLDRFPDWEIVISVDIAEPGKVGPVMGMYLRKHEIIDGLRREYFPLEYRGFQYEDARPGTEWD